MQAIQNYFHQVVQTPKGKVALGALALTVALVAAGVILTLTVSVTAAPFIAVCVVASLTISLTHFYLLANPAPLPVAVSVS